MELVQDCLDDLRTVCGFIARQQMRSDQSKPFDCVPPLPQPFTREPKAAAPGVVCLPGGRHSLGSTGEIDLEAVERERFRNEINQRPEALPDGWFKL